MKRARRSAAVVTEAALQAAIITFARLLGWRVAHFRPAVLPSGKWATHMTGDPGFPDLVLARAGVVIFAELKSDDGVVSPEQDAWLSALGGPDPAEEAVLVVVWRPSDWISGKIDRILSRAWVRPAGVGVERCVSSRESVPSAGRRSSAARATSSPARGGSVGKPAAGTCTPPTPARR